MWMIPEQGLSYTLPHDYPTIKLTQVRNTMKHNNLNPVADKKLASKYPNAIAIVSNLEELLTIEYAWFLHISDRIDDIWRSEMQT